jgi:lipoprotein-anchoring transpeptidase ErfK/SrfK
MRRYLLTTLLIVLGVSIPLAVRAEPTAAVTPDSFEAEARPKHTRYVCVPSLMWRNPELCPSYGPGNTAYRISSIRLPDPLPELPIEELPHDEDDELVPHTYALVRNPPLNVYRHPMEAAAGLPPVRTMLSGSWWVSLDGAVEYEGKLWYQINPGEFIPADAVVIAAPSHFQGVYLTEQPSLPFAWTNQWVRPSVVPQGAYNTTVEPLNKYQLVTIFAEERSDDEIWYLVGENQWVKQSTVGRVDVDPPPEGVPAGAKWIEIDIYEQTIAAYEGERMVYASLISSGRTGTATPPGLYKLWAKIREGKMSNPNVPDGSPSYYYIEDVPWTMYFHQAYALHAAFWHDNFGFTQSHGCVNLTPRDSKWLFNWADPYIPDDAAALYIGAGMPNTWVWVHYTPSF